MKDKDKHITKIGHYRTFIVALCGSFCKAASRGSRNFGLPPPPLDATIREEIIPVFAYFEEDNLMESTTAPAPVETKPVAVDPAAEQLKLLKKIHFMGVVRTIACLLVCLILAGSALYVLPGVNQLVGRLNVVVSNLEQIDINLMTESVTNLAVSGTEGIETALVQVSTALETINRLDIEGLNKSIADLGAVVEPMAKLFGKR